MVMKLSGFMDHLAYLWSLRLTITGAVLPQKNISAKGRSELEHGADYGGEGRRLAMVTRRSMRRSLLTFLLAYVSLSSMVSQALRERTMKAHKSPRFFPRMTFDLIVKNKVIHEQMRNFVECSGLDVLRTRGMGCWMIYGRWQRSGILGAGVREGRGVSGVPEKSMDFLSLQGEHITKSNKGTGLRWMILGIVRAGDDTGAGTGNRGLQTCRFYRIWGRPDLESREDDGSRSMDDGGTCIPVHDARVVKVQKGFMRRLGGVKSRRHPDSFLVYPIAILGVAATCPADKTALLTRLWGVLECNGAGTAGKDIVRMLSDIWTQTTARSAVWADARSACLRVTGM